MRVLVVLNSLYTGGAEFSTLLFYQWLQEKGNEIVLVCLKKSTPSFDPAHFGFSHVQYLSAHSYIGRVREFVSLIKRHKPQLVHSVLYDANMIGRGARVFNNHFVHLESLVNEMYSPHRLKDPNVNWIKLKGYQLLDRLTQGVGVDHFHSTGVSVAAHYRQAIGIRSGRITIIHRGRSENRFYGDVDTSRKLRESLGIDPGVVVMIQVARHEFQKGHDVLLQALSELDKSLQWICLLAGREGNLTTSIRKQIVELNLTEKVWILGHRDDVSQLMAMSDICVFPTRFEGLPGALIEAEAAGLPIVCSDIPNNREVVVENENALLFPVDDVRQMAKQLEKLLTDTSLRQKLGASSLSIYKERFSMEKAHQRMETLVMELISKRETG